MPKKKKDNTLIEILKFTDESTLRQFVVQYAAKDKAFEKALKDQFSPEKKNAGSKKNYADTIRSAFAGNTLKDYRRYEGWDEYGFDAESVADELQPLLEKISYYQQHKNYGEALLICQALIETIPEEWDSNFDYEGDVQVIYDEAIDKIQEMLDQNILSASEKQSLFKWYRAERKDTKHEHVGLNTNLEALEDYFTDSPEMLRENLADIEKQIKEVSDDYKKEDAVLRKIHLLEKAGLQNKAEQTTTQYLRFSDVRKLCLEKYLREKKYEEAIELLHEGVKVAKKVQHPGTAIQWKEQLLKIYELQKDNEHILKLAEELFTNDTHWGGDQYYKILKKYTPKEEWMPVVERLLSKMQNEKGFYGFNDLKASILVEHKMWERLFDQCRKGGTAYLEEYEKYLKPLYAKEIFDTFRKYVEQQATITDKEAYQNVARLLKKMKKYEGGAAIVEGLVKKYRELYKRRKYMMAALDGV